MPRTKVNKAAEIRAEFEKNPDARPKDVIAALEARKIRVSSPQVSNIRAVMNGTSKRGKTARGQLDLQDIQEAHKLVKRLGSVKKAHQAIEALTKLL